MTLLPSLSQIIKGYLEFKLKEKIKRRNDLREELMEGDIVNKSELENELKGLNQLIDENWFSTELLSRELYYLGYYSKRAIKDDYQ